MSKSVSPMYRILVKMIPAVEDYANPLGLTLMDKKKHFDHVVRRGMVVALPKLASVDVQVGEVVLFEGHAGFTLDGDILDPGLDDVGALKGESYRWLKNHEIMAVDDAETIRRKDAPISDAVREVANAAN